MKHTHKNTQMLSSWGGMPSKAQPVLSGVLISFAQLFWDTLMVLLLCLGVLVVDTCLGMHGGMRIRFTPCFFALYYMMPLLLVRACVCVCVRGVCGVCLGCVWDFQVTLNNTTPHHTTTGHTLNNAYHNTGSAMLSLQTPNAALRGTPAGVGGCGDSQLHIAGSPPTLLPLMCAGPMHVYMRDMDGSMWGTPGVVMGRHTLPRPAYEYVVVSVCNGWCWCCRWEWLLVVGMCDVFHCVCCCHCCCC